MSPDRVGEIFQGSHRQDSPPRWAQPDILGDSYTVIKNKLPWGCISLGFNWGLIKKQNHTSITAALYILLWVYFLRGYNFSTVISTTL